MKKLSLILTVIFFLFLSALPLSCRSSTAPSGAKIKVVSTIYPIASLIQRVGGDKVEVVTLLPPGVSPHTFEPRAQDVKAFTDAKLFFAVGAGLDFWAQKLVTASAPNLLLVDLSQDLPLLEEAKEHEEHGRKETAGKNFNPHYWLDPLLAQKLAEKIAQNLSQTDPQNQNHYRERLNKTRQDLAALHQEIQALTRQFTIREFISFHAGWTYFARRYNLKEAGVIETSPGKEPTAKELAAIIATAKKAKVRAIFAEPQFSPKAAEAIAQECRVQVLFLDYLGGPGIKEREDYFSILRYNIKVMSQAMK